MSEYQYYEFRSIDRSLTQKEKEEISSWSTRALVTNASAIFEYHYSDFPKDCLEVVEKYFDVMFYIANWGTRRLIFKIPNTFIDKNIKQYCAEGLEIYDFKEFILIDIWLEEDDDDGGWIEGEGMLNSLITLRNDIISGDYRSLYLLWLKVSTESVMSDYSEVDEYSIEPELPNGLKKLNGALEELLNVFGIDREVVDVASEISEPLKQEIGIDYADKISNLTEAEKNEWLLRLVDSEPLLAQKIKKHFSPKTSESQKHSARTVKDIVETFLSVKEKRKEKERLVREEKRLEKLRKIEEKENSLWAEVYSLIREKKTKAYDEAVSLLKSLKELAVHKKRYEEFKAKIIYIKTENSRLNGLIGRINSANLLKE
ncbi:hypothetical protein BZG01_10520 [Labilibaculum manganireducens]|uniref:Uncharacterized protein n=1 Tax=Labilibaculum manganireducens TaxID=1940525 RepID=A0A2N3I8U4_9BACT|nr:hypothetical protein [Labilibaculum manganireducens]PKQ66698.1 hypothetical protein BZG01_10520 [Labilibaculum manganireducens]